MNNDTLTQGQVHDAEPDYSQPRWIFRANKFGPPGCECSAVLGPMLVRACEQCSREYDIPAGAVMDVPTDLYWPTRDEWLEQQGPYYAGILDEIERKSETRQQRNARWESDAPAEYELLQRAVKRLTRKMGGAR